KKTKRAESNVSGNGNENVLAAIRELDSKLDKTFQKISAIETTTEATSKQVKSLTATVQQLILDVGVHKEALDHMESEVHALRKENKSLKASVQECRLITPAITRFNHWDAVVQGCIAADAIEDGG
ncbi:hypothetical protein PO909_016785, partial [Leuciscus waleckii]